MIRKFQHVVHNIHDIAHAVHIVTRFSSNPKETHMAVVKRIFKYLKGIEEYGLWYRKEGDFELKVYTDVDWARNVDGAKSTSSGALFLGERLVRWLSKKQSCISQSTTQVEYVVVSINCSNISWIKKLLEGMQEEFTKPLTIYCGNTSTINISNNFVMHAKTKHMSIKYLYLREKVQDRQVMLEYVKSKEKITYIFTNPLPKDYFELMQEFTL